MTRATCETCRWFQPNPRIDVPPEPERHFRWLGIKWQRSPVSIDVDNIMRNVILSDNERGRCCRWPKSIEKHRTSFCGEHEPQDAQP